MSKRKFKPIDSVYVSTPRRVVVEIADRRAFDEIAATCVDHGKTGNGHVLSKTIIGSTVDVTFQFWSQRECMALTSRDWEDWKAERAADRDAAAERAA